MTRSGPARIVALDQLRGFVIVLVVLHHAILAYCTFGRVDRLHYALSTAPIVDAARWGGFDVLVKLQDGFFMPLLFLLSGLFVPSGIARAGAGGFIRGRLLRLGLPFAVVELTVVPLAYYPSFLQAGGVPGFGAFWAGTVTAGPWPSGPPWFIGVLLLFDALAALAWLGGWWRRRADVPFRAAWCFLLLVLGSAVAYLPLLGLVGPSPWFAAGPFAVQESRVLLYAGYFAAGVWVGAAGMQGIERCCAALARGWLGWTVLAVGCAGSFLIAGRLGAALGAGWIGALTGSLLVLHCAAMCFALAALFLRFGGRSGGRAGPVWRSLVANGFAIYLLHYPVVTWTQYLLLPVQAGALTKGLASFAVGLTVSWSLASLAGRLPMPGRAG